MRKSNSHLWEKISPARIAMRLMMVILGICASSFSSSDTLSPSVTPLEALAQGYGQDIGRLGTWLLRGELFGLAILIFIVLIGAAATRSFFHFRGRRQVPSGPLFLFGARILLLILVVSIVILYLLHAAPQVTLLGSAAILVALAWSLGWRINAWLSGVSQVLQGRVLKGDRLRLGDSQGIVYSIGLFRIILRNSAGERVHVPLSALKGVTYSTSSPQRSHPVDLQWRFQKPPLVQALERLKRSIQLSPFRDQVAPVEFEITSDDGCSFHIQFRAWSESAGRLAERGLRQALLAMENSGEESSLPKLAIS